MAIYETYSQRQKRTEQAGQPIIYQYEEMPKPFREQVIHILDRGIGNGYYRPTDSYNPHWGFIHDIIAEAIGVASLPGSSRSKKAASLDYFRTASHEAALDFIELTFKAINTVGRTLGEPDRSRWTVTQQPDAAIEDLNFRFRQHSIGYQFVGNEVLRVDSELIHADVVEPALRLLHDHKFTGPEQEFLTAHEHYRHGRNPDAIVNALKAFESTMKAICDERKWQYASGAAAKQLIGVILKEELVPASFQNQLTQLAGVMEALPTVRNKMGGHGQGGTPVEVPGYLAAYALHLAAANIVFLVEAHRAKK